MHFDNLQPGLNAPLPRLDDDEEDDDKQSDTIAKKSSAPVAMLIQKKFLDERKIFLWGAVTDETAKDLTEKLEYRIPTKLRELLSEVVPGALQYANVLDIGCGTGLSGEAFHSISTRLTGIDLSPAMLVKAGEKGLYDNLLAGDAVELIRNSTETFDLVISCDALPYMGDLVPLFTAVATVTAAGGHFLCTTELASGESYSLQTTARFAHSPQYLLECASAAGFDALAQDTKPLRKEKSEWITGGLYCFVRRS